MKTILVLAIALSISGCSVMSKVGAPEARILRADGTHVVLFDPNGNIKTEAASDAAGKYCSASGKTAELESQGGAPLDCVSNQLRYCLTYVCK